MNLLLQFLLILSILIFNPSLTFAQKITPSPTPVVQHTNEFSVQNDSNSIILALKSFVEGLDKFLGGFIFYTPDPLGEKIILSDKSEIQGMTKYRNIFNDIAIPIIAIVIAALAVNKIGSDNTHELRSFATRLITTVVLFITVPFILSYSIQFNNLLVNKISTTQQFTGFINDYLDKSQDAINKGADSEQFGIPHYNFSLLGGVLKYLGEFIVKIFLFALTFLFLLGGFLYIGFQFVIRFATLLFLGVLYPVIIPFTLSEKTQYIVQTFFKSWFTFLIMQPAFVLGFSITTDIFTSILNSQGPSVGMLFFYTGFLFFLGGVNMLVGRIFGSGWDALSTNMQAAVISRGVMNPIQSNVNNYKNGLFGGNISTNLGRKSSHILKNTFKKETEDSIAPFNPAANGKSKPSIGSSATRSEKQYPITPEFSKDLSKRGLQIETINQKQGIVSVSGEAYQYNDPKTGLTSLYPSRIEATQDGIPDSKLHRVKLEKAQFIDLSAFNKNNQNPHNYNAMQESRKRGKDLHYAHITASSHPERVKNFLSVSKSRNEALGVKGVIVKRHGIQTSDHIIRLYSPYENHKNI